MDIELVAEGFEFPEGPIAMADGSVILTEIKGRRLTRVAPDGTKTLVVETGGGPNGAAIGPDGASWITTHVGLAASSARMVCETASLPPFTPWERSDS